MRPMKRALITLIAAGLFCAGQGARAATPNDRLADAELAIRKADAQWVAAGRSGSVDAWLAFYTTDAIVLAPDAPIADTPARVRQSIAELLSLPALSVTWYPTKVEVAAAGDLGYLIGAYEVRYDDPHGKHVTERGKLLEIWRKLPDGSWKCIVDTWNSDGPGTGTATQAPIPAAPAAATAAAVPPPAAPPAPAATPTNAKSGDMPVQYEQAIRDYFQQHLKDPDSVRYQEITKPEPGHAITVSSGVFMKEKRLKGWKVNATIDAKNSHGVYAGYGTYLFLFQGENIVYAGAPPGADVLK